MELYEGHVVLVLDWAQQSALRRRVYRAAKRLALFYAGRKFSVHSTRVMLDGVRCVRLHLPLTSALDSATIRNQITSQGF